MSRSLAVLSQVDDPAITELEQWLQAPSSPARRLPVRRPRAEETLLWLQVSAASTLGALALETGGLVCGGGWLRVLGGGEPGLLGWTRRAGDGTDDLARIGLVVVGHDAAGGFFALDGGALGVAPGQIAYLDPRTLRWEGLGVGHSQFVQWALQGDLDAFYADLRWPGWEAELAGLDPESGVHFHPPLFTREGSPEGSSRRVVPQAELWGIAQDLRARLGG